MKNKNKIIIFSIVGVVVIAIIVAIVVVVKSKENKKELIFCNDHCYFIPTSKFWVYKAEQLNWQKSSPASTEKSFSTQKECIDYCLLK